MEELSDAEALRHSVAEPGTFTKVYERYLPAVHAYLRRRVGDGLAQDLTAEVFVRAFRARGRYGVQHDTALPWLLGFATNIISEHRRAERRRLAVLERLGCGRDVAAPAPSHGALAPEVARALRRLREQDRDALLLVVWGELSYDEAARALGVPIGTVRSRIARARRLLAGELGDRPLSPIVPANGEHHA